MKTFSCVINFVLGLPLTEGRLAEHVCSCSAALYFTSLLILTFSSVTCLLLWDSVQFDFVFLSNILFHSKKSWKLMAELPFFNCSRSREDGSLGISDPWLFLKHFHQEKFATMTLGHWQGILSTSTPQRGRIISSLENLLLPILKRKCQHKTNDLMCVLPWHLLSIRSCSPGD